MSNGPYHNFQQLNDAVVELEKVDKSAEIQSLAGEVSTLKTTVASLQSAVAELQKLTAVK